MLRPLPCLLAAAGVAAAACRRSAAPLHATPPPEGPFDGCAACDPGKEPLIQHLESEDKSAVHAILLPEEYK